MTHHEENNQSKLIQNWNRVKPENKDIKITAIITVLDRLKSWDMKSFFFKKTKIKLLEIKTTVC